MKAPIINLLPNFLVTLHAYIAERQNFGALLGPFSENSIPQGHQSPFLSCHKPDSDRRCVIVDLSRALTPFLNAGIDKTTYFDSRFDLSFPTINDIINKLKTFG